jgi:flavin-dependent dehydrogenase
MDMDATKFYAYTSPKYSKYDAWINSKDGMLVIGVIAEKKTEAQYYHKKFIEFLIEIKNLIISREIREETWCLPLVIPDLDLLFNNENIFFTGEVAGLLNPFGEGISLALSSAIALAGSIKKHRNKLWQYDSIADGYEYLLSKELVYMKRQWRFLMNIAPEFRQNVNNLKGIYRDKDATREVPLPHHRKYGAVSGGSAD